MFKPISQAIQSAADDVTERAARGGVEYIGIPSGIRKLDIISGGFRKKELYVFGGRTGMGKSSLALTFAKHQCNIGCNVGYISLEMSSQVLAYRWLSADLKLSSMKIERGIVTPEQLTIIQNKAGHMSDFQFLVDDNPYASTEISKVLETLDPKLDVLYIDYLSLLRDSGNDNEAERLAKISANLKNIAMTFDIPVVVLVQLNREVEKRANNRPTTSDIRGSGGPEMDGGLVGLIHRPYYYEMLNNGKTSKAVEDDAELIVVKNRFGPMSNIPVIFYSQEMRWEGKE